VQPISHHTEFLTATILRWQNLLIDDKCRQIILDSLAWLSKEGRCKVYGFVIMPNHIHLIWKIKDGYARQEVQAAFLSFTAHEFKKHLSDNKKLLNEYLVNDADRKYQFWERDSRVKECWNESFLLQKLNYIHHNPCQPHWNLSQIPEQYVWSSASFYQAGDSKYPWLCHYKD
jgi:REP element-mobilizing transposase RayT